MDMKRFDEAETEYNRVLETRPGELTAQLGLGAAYWKDRKFGQAEPCLKAVLRVRPNDAQASYMLGEMLVERQEYSNAYPYLVTAANGTGRDAIYAHGLLGKVYASEGKTEQAIAELKLAASTDEDGSLHFQLYRLYQKAGDQQAARTALERSEVLRRQEQKRASNLLPQVSR
jgi:tetratricopeptide (TPR) repeat protein